MYDIVIGIETHIQLKTDSKMFCGCSADFFGQAPNTHTCPVCLGLPGALPVMNKAALDQAMRMGLALHATVADSVHFDRKNYFYPDLAKGYQITQFDEPMNVGGYVEVEGHRIGLIRAHLEEDVGKLTHQGDTSLVDFNKGGVPLLEIVSEPVIGSAKEARQYVQALRHIARYIGVNDGNLERGTMRADINISLQQPGMYEWVDGDFVLQDGYSMNKRVEVKNVNSFRAIEQAIDFEVVRQTAILEGGGEVEQETRGWDEAKGQTIAQRSKEEAHDYRYFPEPDLPPLQIDRPWIEQLRQTLPELPITRMQRFVEQYGLSDYDAGLLVEERVNADWFEQAIVASSGLQLDVSGDEKTHRTAKMVANWMMSDLARLQNETQVLIAESRLLPEQLAKVLEMIADKTISSTAAKQVVSEAYSSGKDPELLVKQLDLAQMSGGDDLRPIAQKIIEEQADAVASYRGGKTGTLMFLVGQVMKETKGRANPAEVKKMLEQLLDG